jgi:hypothetical protein
MNDRTKPVGFIGKDILAVEKEIIPDSKAYRAGVSQRVSRGGGDSANRVGWGRARLMTKPELFRGKYYGVFEGENGYYTAPIAADGTHVPARLLGGFGWDEETLRTLNARASKRDAERERQQREIETMTPLMPSASPQADFGESPEPLPALVDDWLRSAWRGSSRAPAPTVERPQQEPEITR